jgi:hypothetical protein
MPYAIGYRWYDENSSPPAAAHGADRPPDGLRYGLSYAKFSYGNLQVPCSDVSKTGVVNVTVDVTNTSERAGRRDRVPVRVVWAHHLTAPPAQGAEAYRRVHLAGGTPPIRTRWTGTPSESRCRCA